jgi:NAD(P)H-hydrate epimerase
MVTAISETTNGAIDESALEKVLKLSEKMNAVAVGCGLSSNEESTRNFVRKFIEQRRTPVVIDADGLNALAPFDLQGSDELPLILTPHIGEMRRLLGFDESADLSDRVKIIREFAQKHGVILVLKGERSLIAAPDGTVVINPTGNAGIGKAGNGDTLAGIITGFVAQTVAAGNSNIFETVIAALYIAGMAGDIAAKKTGMRSMTASDVRTCLKDAFLELENEGFKI